MDSKGKFAIGCVVAAVVALVIGIVLSVGGYFIYEKFSDNGQETDDNGLLSALNERLGGGETETGMTTGTGTLTELLESATWQEADGGYRYPTFMRRSEKLVTDIPATVKSYTWQQVDFCYWPLIGSWAIDNKSFPAKGCYVTALDEVEDITYRQEDKGIYSGHTIEGRIFYLKKKITRGDAVDHVTVLAVVYPEDQQTEVKPFIDLILNW